MGRRIGSVADSQLRYDPLDGTMSVDATIVLEPWNITLADAAWSGGRAQMDDMIRHLVARGLRADLSSAPPRIGGGEVERA